MEVRWSVLAADDLERICDYIARDNPEAACPVAKAIFDGCGQLKDTLYLGRASSRMPGRRELVFFFAALYRRLSGYRTRG